MKKILFISPDASLTGAPLVLFEILKILVKTEKYYLKVIFLEGGDKFEEFELLCKTEVLQKKGNNIFKKIQKKIFKRSQLIKRLNNEKFDLLYLNSIASFVFFPELEFIKVGKTILHMHESGNFPHYTQNTFNKVVKMADKIICVSNLVKNYLIYSVELNLNKISVIYPYNYDEQNLIDLKGKNFKINKKPFVIGGCGNHSLTKGIDVFVLVAFNFYKIYGKDCPVQFVWLGDNGYQEAKYLINRDIIELGLKDKVLVLPKTNKPLNIFETFDTFFLSSREEAFGLAAFENGVLGNPIICFEKASGVTELFETQNTILPYLDIVAATTLIWKLFDNKEFFQVESEQIQKTFKELLLNSDLEKIEKLIGELIS